MTSIYKPLETLGSISKSIIMQICHVNRSFHDKANAQQYHKWYLLLKDNILCILGRIRSLSCENKEEENGVLPYNKRKQQFQN